MPGCVLRVSGKVFDVDRFLKGSKLIPCAVFRKGEPRFSNARQTRKVNKYSGFNVDAAFSTPLLSKQVRHAVTFLKKYRQELMKLRRFSGVEDARLDFGILQRGTAAQFDYFPPELIRLAGELSIGIEISRYSVAD